MRWRIRSQLLLPLLLLLLGVFGLSVWMAFAAANHARQQIETRVRNVAQIVSEGKFPLAPLRKTTSSYGSNNSPALITCWSSRTASALARSKLSRNVCRLRRR